MIMTDYNFGDTTNNDAATSGNTLCSDITPDRKVDIPDIALAPSIVERERSRLRRFFDLDKQEVQSIARQIALEFSDEPEFLKGVRKLFTTSDGLSAEDLKRDAMMFVTPYRPIHSCHEPLIGLEKRLTPFINPVRLASVLRLTWQSSKIGFNLLPNPAALTLEEYGFEADCLMCDITDGEYLCLERLLTNTEERDLDFWNSLPRKFTVYRGSYGVSAEKCAAGVCWTTKREIAEWFALRAFREGDPVLVRARIHKTQVSTVFANEYEIAVQPNRFKQLKIRQRDCGRFPDDGEWNGEVADNVTELAQHTMPNKIQEYAE